ncbi:MAG: hypothetical protein JEY94_17225 [Melioribacteraceae bacterium]|nr:hypothetical protein [Melioribacteraceae bacterium]
MKIQLFVVLFLILGNNIFAQIDSVLINNNIEIVKSKILTLEKSISRFEESEKKQIVLNNSLTNQLDSIKSSYYHIIRNNEKLLTTINSLKNQFNKITVDIKIQEENVSTLFDSLNNIARSNTEVIKKIKIDLSGKIETNQQVADKSITKLEDDLSRTTLYWIIAILIIVILVIVLTYFLRKQIFKQKIDLDSTLKETRKSLEEEGVKLDNKLIEVLETQLKVIENSGIGKSQETDHTLALKVADEIIRIQKNLTRMDENTKGLKQLIASVKRIQDNFASNGYELVEMLGLEYNEGMKVSANFILDESLEPGKQTITRIIKPQVNYKGVMIQSAQIEVSQGE